MIIHHPTDYLYHPSGPIVTRMIPLVALLCSTLGPPIILLAP